MPPGAESRTRALVVVTIAVVTIACGGASNPDLGLGNDGGAADGASDGGDGGSDARADGGPFACNLDGGPFPTLSDGCTGNDACVVGIHQIDCCGSKIALGLNHALLNTFQKDEAEWEASCPLCGCPPKPLLAQDGKSGQPADVRVLCDMSSGSGKCKTFFP